MASIPRLPEGTSLQVGTHRVTIVSYLSEGGYAHIYSVHMDPLEGENELACLKRVIIPDKSGLYQLRKEVEVMKTLRGAKSIVQYYDSHAERQNDGTYQVLLLMELCPNKSLLDYMNARLATKLTEGEILKILLDVSLGVYEMHRKNLIHRDIKIENVLIDIKSRFKLCDFGSTTSPIMPPTDVQRFQWLANDLLYQTTPQYRAPEMIDLYKGFAIDERADIWALGCFLYKLCYFTTPFEASGDISILHGAFQYLPSPQFSNDLKNLILVMLQENPFYRPNIAQVIMLVSQMVGLDFGSLNIPEISRTGPYDFQGLYDYQRQKQEEIAGQQQLYLQSKNFYIAHASPDSQAYPSVNSENNLTNNSLLPSVEPSSIPQVVDPKPQRSPKQDIELAHEDENSENLKNLEDAEERYPSLEDLLDYPSRGKTTGSESTKTLRETRRPSNGATSAQMSRISSGVDITKDSYKVNPQISRENTFSRQYMSNHVSKQNEFYSPTLQLQHKLPSRSNERASSELEREEGWQTHNAKINKSAERLVDDIFTTGSKTPINVPPSENLNRTSEELQEYKKKPLPSGTDVLETDGGNLSTSQKSTKNTEPLENSSEMKTRSPKEAIPDELYLDAQGGQKEETFHPEMEPAVLAVDQNSQVQRPQYYNALTADGDIEYAKAPRPVLAADTLKEKDGREDPYDRYSNKDTRKHGNPWGSYTEKRSSSGIRDHSAPPVNEKVRSKAYDYSQRGPHELIGSLSIDTGFPKGRQIADPIDSNDLINLKDPVPQDSLQDTSKKPAPMQGMNEIAVVDLDNEKVTYEENPRFKKKTNSQPRLNVQEEVIDFASDDENPEHNSEMNRLSIRNSLKKPKSKKAEHQRTESNSSEGKKILGFQLHRKT